MYIGYGLISRFKTSLIIHEENTKEINVKSMIVNRIKICPDLHKLQL
jgi:hypothetical protein